ncbi:CopG family ribbon-helix-helix protein [Desulfoplanes sp.]
MSTVTARIPEETAFKLSELAKTTNRSKSFLIAQALEQFLEKQAWQVTQIKESLAQADAGKFASPSEVHDAFSEWGLTVEGD